MFLPTPWQGCLILDGGLATELEARGHDLSSALWSAQILEHDPSAIREAHRRYLDAGADVITTATYQASFQGFSAAGISPERAEELLQLGVRLAVEARDQFWAPRAEQGAFLADGSEYTGDYPSMTSADLQSWHARRLELLARCPGVDFLALETLPSLKEVQALVECLLSLPDTAPKAWMTFACRDGLHINDGSGLASALELINALDPGHRRVVAVGVNCTAPEHVPDLIKVLNGHRHGRMLVIYPNSGEAWDGEARAWVAGTGCCDPASFAAAARGWLAAVAPSTPCLVGGCCRTSPATISALRAALVGDNPSCPELRGPDTGTVPWPGEASDGGEDDGSGGGLDLPRPFDWEPHTTYVDKRGKLTSGEAEEGETRTDKSGSGVEKVLHKGRCHCGAVKFSVRAPPRIVGWDCNCTICAMKRNTHFVVPTAELSISQQCRDALAVYSFGTHTAKHLFCRTCGVVPFYQPRSNPDGFAITVHCLEPGTVQGIEVRHFDGDRWEDFIDGSGIRAFSAATEEV